MEKQKCPEIRFNQFNENWSIISLGDLMNVGSVKRVHQADWCDTGVRFLRARDIVAFAKNEDIADPIYISQDRYEEYSKLSGKVKVGDLLVTGVGTIGVPMLVGNDDPLYFKDGNVIWFKNENAINGLFLYYSFINKTIQNFIKDSAGIGTVGTYTITSGKRTPIYLPKENEQIQIGNFFQNLDQSIALQEKKLTQTQNLKKAMLEKMFPKAGSNQPEVRLKGFSGDWDTINLGSLCYIGDIDHRMPESNTSGIPYLMTGDFFGINGLDFKNAKLISNQDYEQLSKKIKPVMGDILFARYASVGTVRLVVTDVKFLISYSCAILKTSVSSNGEYLFYWFQTSFAQNQIEQEINTGSQRNIGIDSLKKLSVSLPKTSEQKAIANFFKKLDETLALQQQQFQTLKNLKQAFLEKMFV
ncbi:restriction endonuclease subunit S [Acinetobacter bereziniae]|uniref:restriction endonuclease subunit S n=1 Tax=Acinetobacter bereziniae TaxID=106648 RepID=UPI0015DAE937|nr:restriction endonuclease subunit S [Acinetobacter bereziniae]MBJ9905966.1 restriction endonuclease subunit S [Acinetobacter bereziniae]MBJ9927798.1 restriction endonuclease subunit S [Acinetobacter bereziniae]